MTTFGLHLTTFTGPAFDDRSIVDGVTEIAHALEDGGAFDTLWLTGHVQDLGPGGREAPMPEAYVLLGSVAAVTRTLRLGVLATPVLFRPPTVLAKTVTTLDVLSGGRAILGIGAGHPWTADEHAAYGIPFPPIGDRMAALDDALVTIGQMVGRQPVDGAPPNSPRPAQRRGVPVLVAGSGEQRLLRIAARHANLINLSSPSGDTLDRIPHKLDVLAGHCRTVGRDVRDIGVTYKAMLSLAESADAARDLWAATRWSDMMPGAGAREGVFVGDAAQVRAQLEPWLGVGIDHFVFELPATDVASIKLATEVLHDLTT